MSPPRRSLLVVNRSSRAGAELAALMARRLRAGGVEVREFQPRDAAAMADGIRERCGEVDAVVVGGGDGTLHAALPALLDCPLPLGILPLGTANDAARSLGLPTDPEAACAVVLGGTTAAVDLGRANGTPFLNAANIGLGVTVTRELRREEKARWGVLGYLRAVLRSLRRNRTFHAHIMHDGQVRRVRTMQLAVGNGRHYGGGMTIAEDATIDDGLLHLYSIAPMPWWRLFGLGPALRRGSAEHKHGVSLLRARVIEVRTRRSLAVVTDGEPTTRTPVRFEVLAGALRVFVPPQYADDEGDPTDAAG